MIGTDRGRTLVVGSGVLALAVLLLVRQPERAVVAQNPVTRPALPRRVTVEVLNAGGVAGYARDATLALREGGLDVVFFGNAPPRLRDTTLVRHRVLVRRGDTLGVGRIREVLGEITVVEEPDATRLVDLTVLLARPAKEP